MKDSKKITPTKKKASKETQAMAVRKAGDKGYTKGFEAGKIESTDAIKELQADVKRIFAEDRSAEERKVLDKAAKDASKELIFWQIMAGMPAAYIVIMVARDVLGW